MNRYVSPLLLVILVASSCAKVRVVHVTKGATIAAEGVFYALPRTVVKPQIKIDKVKKAAAPYAMFAGIFVPEAEPVCGAKPADCRPEGGKPRVTETYTVQQGATFSTLGEPDPDQVYMVEFTGGGAVDQALSMTWSESGLLTAASAQVTNRTIDIAVATVKVIAGVGLRGAGWTPAAATPTAACQTVSANDTWVFRQLAAAPVATQERLLDNYCGLSLEVRNGYETTDEALLATALRAYTTRLLGFVDARRTLLTTPGSTPDAAALVAKLDAAIEEQTVALFTGRKATKTWDVAFELRTVTPGTPIRIAGVDKAGGVCVEEALLAYDAKPRPEDFATLAPAACDAAAAVTVGVAFEPDAATQVFSAVKAGVREPTGDRSFRYRIPAQVRATLKVGAAEHGAARLSIAQLGHTASLPARRNSKSLSYELAMVEATGALKTFKLGTTGGLDASTIDALAGVGGTVLDARDARRTREEAARKAAETAADELTLLTRESTLLKLKHEICEIQKKYGIACSVER